MARPAARLPRAIALPKPVLRGGRTVAQALQARRTVREVGPRPLGLQALSNLLWAACGVNRRPGPFGAPGRTAATASNSQEIDVYVLRAEGAYRYDPFAHRLEPAAAGDLRALAIGRGQGGMGAQAPVRLVFVADLDRLEHTQGFEEPGLHDPDVQRAYAHVDTGMMAANVYLYAASAGLAAWFHNCDRAALAPKLGLRPDQRALFGQTVGHAPSARVRRSA